MKVKVVITILVAALFLLAIFVLVRLPVQAVIYFVDTTPEYFDIQKESILNEFNPANAALVRLVAFKFKSDWITAENEKLNKVYLKNNSNIITGAVALLKPMMIVNNNDMSSRIFGYSSYPFQRLIVGISACDGTNELLGEILKQRYAKVSLFNVSHHTVLRLWGGNKWLFADAWSNTPVLMYTNDNNVPHKVNGIPNLAWVKKYRPNSIIAKSQPINQYKNGVHREAAWLYLRKQLIPFGIIKLSIWKPKYHKSKNIWKEYLHARVYQVYGYKKLAIKAYHAVTSRCKTKSYKSGDSPFYCQASEIFLHRIQGASPLAHSRQNLAWIKPG